MSTYIDIITENPPAMVDIITGGTTSIIDVFGISIDGGGAVITTGIKRSRSIPFNCTITGWIIIGDPLGSIVMDVWKDSYGNFPPTVLDSITGTDKPTLNNQLVNSNLAVTNWITEILAGDVLMFNVDSVATATKIDLYIHYRI